MYETMLCICHIMLCICHIPSCTASLQMGKPKPGVCEGLAERRGELAGGPGLA